MASRSLALTGYGGDLVRNARGGLAIVSDSPAGAFSSLQRTELVMFTCPQQQDDYGNVIARGDSLQYQEYGVGISSYIDSTQSLSLNNELTGNILNQLAQDPGLIQNPIPNVNIVNTDSNTMNVSVVAKTNLGQVFTTPAYPLSAISTSGG